MYGGAYVGDFLICVAMLTQSYKCVTVPCGAPTVLGDCVPIALLGACPRPYQCNAR